MNNLIEAEELLVEKHKSTLLVCKYMYTYIRTHFFMYHIILLYLFFIKEQENLLAGQQKLLSYVDGIDYDVGS